MAVNVAKAIPEHFRRAFADTWEQVDQQENERLSKFVTMRGFEGKEEILTDLDTVEFTETTGQRFEQSDPSEVEGLERKWNVRTFDCIKHFARNDNQFLAQLGQPDSELISAMKMSSARVNDTNVALSASATVYGGEDPYSTAIDLPSTQQVAVNFSGSNDGLTPQKVIEARKIFETNEIYSTERELYLAISPDDRSHVSNLISGAGNDVWASHLNEMEKGGKFFGFNIIMTNRLAHVTATDITTNVAWSKDGIYMRPDSFQVHIDRIATAKHKTQIAVYKTGGWARRQETRVVEIFNDQSP